MKGKTLITLGAIAITLSLAGCSNGGDSNGGSKEKAPISTQQKASDEMGELVGLIKGSSMGKYYDRIMATDQPDFDYSNQDLAYALDGAFYQHWENLHSERADKQFGTWNEKERVEARKKGNRELYNRWKHAEGLFREKYQTIITNAEKLVAACVYTNLTFAAKNVGSWRTVISAGEKALVYVPGTKYESQKGGIEQAMRLAYGKIEK